MLVPASYACTLFQAAHTSLPQAALHPPPALPPLSLPCAVASRVQNALETALLHNVQLREALVTQLGFAVKVWSWLGL